MKLSNKVKVSSSLLNYSGIKSSHNKEKIIKNTHHKLNNSTNNETHNATSINETIHDKNSNNNKNLNSSESNNTSSSQISNSNDTVQNNTAKQNFKLSFDNFKEFTRKYFSSIKVKSLLSGVITDSQIKSVSGLFDDVINKLNNNTNSTNSTLNLVNSENNGLGNNSTNQILNSSISDLSGTLQGYVMFKPGVYVYNYTNNNPNDINNALLNVYLLDTTDLKNYCLLKLTNLYFGNAFYDYLRTEKQFGYIADSSIGVLNKNITVRV